MMYCVATVVYGSTYMSSSAGNVGSESGSARCNVGSLTVSVVSRHYWW